MKKVLGVLVLLIFAFSFQACDGVFGTKQASGGKGQEISDENDKILEGRKLDIDMSKAKSRQRFEPILEVLPTIDKPAIYLITTDGKLNFVNRKGEIVKIPKESVKYSGVFEYEFGNESQIQCYALYTAENKMAVMTLGGKLTTDFIYDAILGENGYFTSSKNGLIKVGINKNESNQEMLYGLVDIENGKELIKCEYDDIFFSKSNIIAHKLKDVYIFDYMGNLLTKKEKSSVFVDSYRLENDSVYVHDPYTGDIYLTEDEEIFGFFENFIVFRKANDLLKVYNRKGALLYSYDKYHSLFELLGKELCVVSDDSRLFFDDDKNIKLPFSKAELLRFELLKVTENGFTVIESVLNKDESNVNETEYFEKDFSLEGKLLKTNNITDLKNEYMDFYLNKPNEPYIINKGDKIKVVKNIDEVIVPETDFAHLWIEGDFIIAYSASYGDHGSTELQDAKDNIHCEYYVHDKNGKLLEDKLFGVIKGTYNDGKILVYKDAKNAGFLNSKGDFEEILSLPEVKNIYNKG